jgi:hypothetical protein
MLEFPFAHQNVRRRSYVSFNFVYVDGVTPVGEMEIKVQQVQVFIGTSSQILLALSFCLGVCSSCDFATTLP